MPLASTSKATTAPAVAASNFVPGTVRNTTAPSLMTKLTGSTAGKRVDRDADPPDRSPMRGAEGTLRVRAPRYARPVQALCIHQYSALGPGTSRAKGPEPGDPFATAGIRPTIGRAVIGRPYHDPWP